MLLFRQGDATVWQARTLVCSVGRGRHSGDSKPNLSLQPTSDRTSRFWGNLCHDYDASVYRHSLCARMQMSRARKAALAHSLRTSVVSAIIEQPDCACPVFRM
jgi:hypothetical protein